jgi:hypothetical protein
VSRRQKQKRVNERGKVTTTEAPAPKPWLAAVLAIDTARISGWSIRIAGKQHEFGEVDTTDADAVLYIVQWAIKRAAHAEVPLVLVLERPWGGTVNTVDGLGGARERWARAWRDCKQSEARLLRVHVPEWRAAVLGGYWVSAPREEVRPHEQLTAALMVGQEVGEDEAPAILIGHWASMAAKVGRAIGKRAVDASKLAWSRRSAA